VAARNRADLPPNGYAGQLAEATGPFLDRFLAFDVVLARHHLTGAPHHHLAILAVRPDTQCQGIGTALVQAHHAAFDWHRTLDDLLAAADHALYQAKRSGRDRVVMYADTRVPQASRPLPLARTNPLLG
jgi:GNAT superfamily N-acetyltransferase